MIPEARTPGQAISPIDSERLATFERALVQLAPDRPAAVELIPGTRLWYDPCLRHDHVSLGAHDSEAYLNQSREVAAWLESYDNPMRDVVRRVRDIILRADPRIEEGLESDAPTFSYRGTLASIFPESKKHVSLMVGRGAEIPGHHPRLEGSNDPARVMKIQDVAEANAAKDDLQHLVRAWCDWRDAEAPASDEAKAKAKKKPAAKKKAAPKKKTARPAAKKTRTRKKTRPAAKKSAAKKSGSRKKAAVKPAARTARSRSGPRSRGR